MDHLLDIALGRTHPNAPIFWSMTFVFGAWMIMFGAVNLYERSTRGMRLEKYQAPETTDWLVRLGLIDRRTSERLVEATLITLGSIGRKSWRVGIWISLTGAALGTWRNTVWPYS